MTEFTAMNETGAQESPRKKRKKRFVDIVVLSDIHLGTWGCHATELLRYLKTIRPGVLILNGDIIDMWQFSKKYWPHAHMRVVKHIVNLVSKGVPVYYITGNHDEMLRRFRGFRLGSFSIVNKLLLDLPGGKAWFFHGDVFDVTMQHSKWLAQLGGHGYDALILLNRFLNYILEKTGRGRISFSKKIKDNVKSAVRFIHDFEQTAADLAISKGYSYVVCGHIHQPVIREAETAQGRVNYLNSGDWVENLTALEYHAGNWTLYRYWDDPVAQGVILRAGNETASLQYENLIREMQRIPGLRKEKAGHSPASV